jgi:hypothetical protein
MVSDNRSAGLDFGGGRCISTGCPIVEQSMLYGLWLGDNMAEEAEAHQQLLVRGGLVEASCQPRHPRGAGQNIGTINGFPADTVRDWNYSVRDLRIVTIGKPIDCVFPL